MAKYYSPSLKGFYDDSIHRPLPADAVPLSDDQWRGLIDGQSKGQRIAFEGDAPYLTEHPPAELDAAFELHKVDTQLNDHRMQQDLGEETTLTAEQFQGLLRYRKSLRSGAKAEVARPEWFK